MLRNALLLFALMTVTVAPARAGSFPILHSFELPNPGSLGVAWDGECFWVSASSQYTGQTEFYLFTPTGTLAAQAPQGGGSSGWGYRDLAFQGSWMFGSCTQAIDGYDPLIAYAGSFFGPLSPNRALTYDGTYFYTTGFGEDLYRILWDGSWGSAAAVVDIQPFPTVHALAHDGVREGLWATTPDAVHNLLFFGSASIDSFTTLPEYANLAGCEVADTEFGRVLAVVAPGDPAELVLYDIVGSTIHTVCPDGSGDFLTIQEAINAAEEGDIIELCDAVFTGAGNRDLDCNGKALHIRSQSRDPEACIIDCAASTADQHRAIRFNSGEGPGTILEGLTIRNGQMGDEAMGGMAGAVLCGDLTTPRFLNCHFLTSRSTLGAAVCCISGTTVSFEDCVFQGNETIGPPGGGHGGGLYLDGTTQATLTRCLFGDNFGYSGGGIYVGGTASAAVDGCTFVNNAGAHYGGGIATAGLGKLVLTGSTFYGNNASGFGGGLAHWSQGEAILENTIIAFGTMGGAFDGAAAACLCCDIYGNAGGDWISGIAGLPGVNGNFSADPSFCDAPAGDFQLWNYTPCVQQACGQIGAWPIGCWDPMGVEPDASQEPSLLTQSRNHPNPFSGTTRIEFALSSPAEDVTVRILDANGRLVRTLPCGRLAAGAHQMSWDGSGAAGQRVSSGIYYYRLCAQGEIVTRSMVLLPLE